jgi:hypothetical protein
MAAHSEATASATESISSGVTMIGGMNVSVLLSRHYALEGTASPNLERQGQRNSHSTNPLNLDRASSPFAAEGGSARCFD